MEMWKDIPGYEGIYQASNLGNIRSAPNKVTANDRYSTRIWKSRNISNVLTHGGKIIGASGAVYSVLR